MIRRLHFEEVQPPPHAINPAGEIADPKDDQERQSLALEFKELLATVGGGIPSLSDQSTALGLALAQALPTERIVHQDLHKADDSQQIQDEDQFDVLDDQSSYGDDRAIGLEQSDIGARADGAKTQAEEDDEKAIQVQTAVIQTGGLIEDEVGPVALVSELGRDLAQITETQEQITAIADCDQVQAEAHVQVVTEDQGSQVQDVASVEALENAISRVETHLMQGNEARIQLVDHSNDEEEGDESFDLAPSAVGLDSQSTSEASRYRPEPNKAGIRDTEVGLNQAASASTPSQVMESHFENATQRSERLQQFGEVVAEAAQTRPGESARKNGQRVDHDESFLSPELISPPATRGPVLRPEHSIQMTLLRQAFESLKHARLETAEGGSKGVAPTVTAAGTSSQPRRADGDVSTRGQRGLTKGQTARMLERVESTLKEAARARNGKTISLRLDPANLGRVKVDVSLRDGALHARLMPENQQVMTALRDNAHELQGALRKLGLNVDTVSVTVSSEKSSDDSRRGGQMDNGSSFRHEGHNMPEDRPQVADFRIGNELADLKKAGVPEETKAVVDHWVA